MSYLDDILAEESAAYVNADELAESVIVTNKKGEKRTVYAVVNRGTFTNIPGGPPNPVFYLDIFIRNDATAGITSIDLGSTTITVNARHGGSSRAYIVQELLNSDAAGWQVRCY